jgi:hypothetical protein
MRFFFLLCVACASRNDLSPKSVKKLLHQTVDFYFGEKPPRPEEASFEESLDFLVETLSETPNKSNSTT